MLSAFGEPPDSGKNRPACAAGAATSAPATAAQSASSKERRERGPGTGPAVYGRYLPARVVPMTAWAMSRRREPRAGGAPLYDPANRAGRFSTNAATPSAKSPEAAI